MSRGARGGAITLASEASKLVAQLISLVVLSRLLTPADFGLVAMATVLLVLGDLLRDFGIPAVALSRTALSQRQASNLLWISSILGLTGGLLLLAFTPIIVLIFDEPRLGAIVPVVSLNLLLNAIQVQFRVHLARKMQFFALAVSDISATIVGIIVAIAAALSGLGYWALILQVVSQSFVLLVARSVQAKWMPSLPHRNSGTTEIVRAGLNVGFSQVLTYGASNADTIAIGAQWGDVELGYYNRAFQLLTTPMRATVGVLTNVVVPTVRRASGSSADIDAALLRIQAPLAICTTWIYMLAASLAPTLVPFVLGEQWGPSIHLFQILAIGGVMQSLSYVSYWSFLLHEKTRSLLYYNLVTKTLTIVAVVLASFISVEAVAWAYTFSLLLSWPINLIWLHRAAGQRSLAFFLGGGRVIVAATLGFVAGWGSVSLASSSDSPALVTLLLGTITCTAVYAGALLVTARGRSDLRETLKLARSVARRRKR